jgi:hypothetical protein
MGFLCVDPNEIAKESTLGNRLDENGNDPPVRLLRERDLTLNPS